MRRNLRLTSIFNGLFKGWTLVSALVDFQIAERAS